MRLKNLLSLPAFVLIALLLTVSAPSKAQGIQAWEEYLTAETTNKKIKINIGEYYLYDEVNPVFDRIIPDWYLHYQFLSAFKDAVLRAMNTLESMFANVESRQILINCCFYRENASPTHATADPWWVDNLKWGNLGDVDNASESARVTAIDYVWKYGERHDPSFYDVLIYYSSPTDFDVVNKTFGSFYTGESATCPAGMVDVETVTLHEIGHALGFYGGNGYGKSKLDLMTYSQPSALTGGGLEWHIDAPIAAALNGGNTVQMMPGVFSYDPHIRNVTGALLLDGTHNIGAARKYSDVELALFQEMGWTLTKPVNLVKVDDTMVGGTVTTSRSVAFAGDEVWLTATAEDGYELGTFEVVTASGATVVVSAANTFVMPSEEVVVKAVFESTSTTALESVKQVRYVVDNGCIVSDEAIKIFDLLGRDVTASNGTLNGVYIVRAGNSVEKVLVK